MLNKQTSAIWGAVVAAIVSVIIVLSVFSYVLTMKQEKYAVELINHSTDVAKADRQILQDLIDMDITNCSPESILKIQAYQYVSLFPQDIGVFKDGKLLCSAGIGFRNLFINFNEPEVTSGAYKVWWNRHLTFMGKKSVATVFGRDNIAIILDTFKIFKPLLNEQTMQMVHVRGGEVYHVIGTDNLFDSDVDPTKITVMRNFNYHSYQQCIPLGYCYKIQRDTFDYFSQPHILIITAIFALLCGGFVYLWLDQYLQRVSSPASRVKHGLKNKAFYPLYQPIVNMETGALIGCEILARFKDKYGELYPDEFIPMISEKHSSWAFTSDIMEQAFTELEGIREYCEEFKVSVNLFPQDIMNDKVRELPELLKEQMDKYILNLEITEQEYLETNTSIDNLKMLSASQFLISIDDFGTGYSNLHQVEALNCDFLKIDKTFVNAMEKGAIKSSLIPHIIMIASTLDMHIIAEGIENQFQAQELKSLGIKYGQGWFFAKAMPMADLKVFMKGQGIFVV